MDQAVLLASFDSRLIVMLAVFAGIWAVVWVVLESWANGANRSEKRLDEIRNPNLRWRKEENQSGNAMTRVLEAATPALAKPLQPKNEKEASAIKQRLCEAGFRFENATTVFLGLKVCGLGLGAVSAGVFTLFQGQVDFGSLMKVVASAGICFYLPELLLTLLRSRRKESIFLGLPDALDLMVVCVEAGLGLDQAMRKVSDEMKKSSPTIADEFGLYHLQMQMGRTRNHVLRELGARSGVDDLRSLASILIQADKFGSSIAQALRVQSDAMRTRRKQIAEEKAAKTAVKLIFPLVIFIFPGIFVVLVGPAAVTMVKEMFPIMGS